MSRTETTLERVKKRKTTLENIARRVLDLKTLDTQKSDRLDFSEQAVWSILRAMEEAFEAGRYCEITTREERETVWACQATVEGKQHPTFYLHGATQGIVSKDHAIRIAWQVLNLPHEVKAHMSVEEI